MRTLFQDCTQRTGKRTLFVSLSVHALVLGALIVLPLISYAALPEARLVSYLSVPAMPDAPVPPAPAPAPSRTVEVRTVVDPEWVIPVDIPDHIPPPTDEPPSTIAGLAGETGPPGAIPSGSVGLEGIPPTVIGPRLPEPPKPAPKPQAAPRPRHLEVSEGIVLSKAIRKVQPHYPPLAKRARVQGAVMLNITIDEQGNVHEILVKEGNPLLIQAAREAVAQWKFSPTLLNGQPVKVKATISIVFRLN